MSGSNKLWFPQEDSNEIGLGSRSEGCPMSLRKLQSGLIPSRLPTDFLSSDSSYVLDCHLAEVNPVLYSFAIQGVSTPNTVCRG